MCRQTDRQTDRQTYVLEGHCANLCCPCCLYNRGAPHKENSIGVALWGAVLSAQKRVATHKGSIFCLYLKPSCSPERFYIFSVWKRVATQKGPICCEGVTAKWYLECVHTVILLKPVLTYLSVTVRPRTY